MRVIVVGPVPPPFGGMANQTLQLYEKLASQGIEVELVPTNRPYWPAWVGYIKGVRAVFRLLPYLLKLWRTARRGGVFHVMANSGWSWHLFAAPAVWIAFLRGRKVVLNYRGGEAERFFAQSFFWVKPTLARCAEVVVPSEFLKEIFSRYGVRTEVIPNPVDLKRFAPGEKTYAEGPTIIVCRHLEAIYGIDVALVAFAKVLVRCPRARLLIAGTGPERARLGSLAKELGIADHVTFTGQLTHDQMRALYATADLMLNPSRIDNAPNVLLEAMASGVPIVSTNAGGIPCLVKHGTTALLVPVDDADAMAEAVLRLLGDAALRQHLTTNGYRRVKQHNSWEVVLARWIALYQKVLTAD
ncbi:MAG: glycosyltransferase family 4 protein [Methylohalobius sp.]|nr:glycosyltransferase family 4 protein [Methylohalobius sp.]